MRLSFRPKVRTVRFYPGKRPVKEWDPMNKTAIIGFGGGGYHAAKALRESDPTAQIDVYTDTMNVPANPMLTTYYVAGKISRETQMPYGPADKIAQELGLNLILRRVKSLRAAERVIVRDDGTETAYDDIVIASGSHPLVPPIQGLPDKGIFVMRTVADADKLLAEIEKGVSSALVIGASWVGIKVVEALYAHQIPTIMADMAPRIFPTATLPETAEVIHTKLRDMGIGLKFGSGISSVCAEGDGIVSTFADGTEIRTQIVALCLGLRPTVDFICKDEFDMGRGLRVDEHMRTSVPHIYAIGDCCEAKELITHQPMAVNLWANAFVQGTVAGHCIAGLEDHFQGNFIHNITHFLDMDFIGLGDNRSQGELVTYRHPTEDWMFYAIVSDGAPRCVNILDNRRVSGPAKAALIKRFSMPDATLPAAARLALRQSGLPESLIAKIGGYGCD